MKYIKNLVKGLERKLISTSAGVAVGLASLLPTPSMPIESLIPIANKAEAKIISVNPSIKTPDINKIISNSNPGDTITWSPELYQHGYEESYSFLGDRNYVFQDGVTVKGYTIEGGRIFKVFGSNVNIIGLGNVIMKNTGIVGMFGAEYVEESIPPLTNVNVSGLTSISSGEAHYIWNNKKHETDRKAPDINFLNMVLQDGIMGFNFASLGEKVDGTTPYLSLKNITANNILGTTGDGKLTAIPKTSIERKLLPMQDYIEGIILINTLEISKSSDWPLFQSPQNLAQQNVDNPLISGKKYDWGVFDKDEKKNCFITDDIRFIPGTYIPKKGYNPKLELSDGGYIGAYKPAYQADQNLDGKVDITDAELFAKRWKDAKGSKIGDVNYDGRVDFRGVTYVEYVSPDGGYREAEYGKPDGKITLSDIDNFTRDYQDNFTRDYQDAIFYLSHPTIPSTPEPSTLLLMALGSSYFAFRRKNK